MNRVGVVDYGMGNLLSVRNALEMIGASCVVCRSPEELRSVDRIVLPGVGAFPDCMANLEVTGLREALVECVLREGKPILGICLGMQVMAAAGVEGRETAGFGWIDARVVSISEVDANVRIPHVGWNDVKVTAGADIFRDIAPGSDFYFVHSFFMQCAAREDVVATVTHGGELTAAVQKDNIVGVQFHPEKSQGTGLQLLHNFAAWNP